ncbi:MAG: carbamoyltransferase HypF [Pirellulales bacterium]
MTSATQLSARPIVARRIVLKGAVQGVGLRPRVARLADECGLAGQVRNTAAGVEIEVEGVPEAIEQLVALLAADERLHLAESSAIEPRSRRDFAIVPSDAAGSLATPVPLDVAVCSECLRETADSLGRRYGYPFTSCTACGPRYSIVERMPFDRSATGMARFSLCKACAREYALPSDRRFHAQTTACPVCGPQVWAADDHGRRVGDGSEAVRASVAALRAGRIVALRGLGGYQLLCNATADAAVVRLRQRKGRKAKPLAVLVESLVEAERWAVLSNAERDQLAAAANPIVTVRARAGAGLAPEVHPGLAEVGLLLPTTPLHFLLSQAFHGPLVCTSGNREGEPLAASVTEAEQQLGGVADLFLHHDRPIERPIDDSVVRVVSGRPVTMRLARGLAPLPLELPWLRPLIALGGQQKSAVALCNGAQAALGPHVGDLDSLATLARYQEHVESLVGLYRLPAAFSRAIDLHPDYAARRWTETQSCSALHGVQHHHAHIGAGMVAQGWLDREVLGVAFDGAGYGPDGTIWGGEFLRASVRGFERVACLCPFPLLGGDAAVRQPWRVALVMLQRAIGAGHPRVQELARRAAMPIEILLRVVDSETLSPRTSSVGRLFDGVAALALGLEESGFEGYPAMQLESACDPTTNGAYELPLLRDTSPAELDWRPLIAAVVGDLETGASPGEIAMRFHRGLAAAIGHVARGWPALPVVLGGGVFQNRVLTELVAEQLAGRELALPGLIPPGDGGLAAGQLAIALASAHE